MPIRTLSWAARTVTLAALVASPLLGTACSSSSGSGGPTPVPEPAGFLFVGHLADSDLGQAQAQHDALANDIEATAREAGDSRHTVMLGTSILGTTPNEFFALDRWTDGTGADAFYTSAAVSNGFAQLFAPAPDVTAYVPATSWAAYGTVDSADSADPYYWVVVRGTMKYDDLSQDQSIHDSILDQFSPLARGAGDVAHAVYTGRDQKNLYFSIDVWPASTVLASFYSNPQFGAAISQLFAGPPTVGIYQSTHWAQW